MFLEKVDEVVDKGNHQAQFKLDDIQIDLLKEVVTLVFKRTFLFSKNGRKAIVPANR